MKLISILILRRKNLIKKKKGRASTIINGHIFDLTSRDICTIDVSTSGSKSRSPKEDQSLLGRLFGQNWSPLSLLLLRKSPIYQNIEENLGFFKQFGTHIRIKNYFFNCTSIFISSWGDSFLTFCNQNTLKFDMQLQKLLLKSAIEERLYWNVKKSPFRQ